MQRTTRTQLLLDQLLRHEHARFRVPLPQAWNTSTLPLSLEERKAEALKLVMARMPLVLLPGELLVGGRTVFGRMKATEIDAFNNPTEVRLYAYPPYATDAERKRLGGGEGGFKNHIVPGYARVLAKGLSGLRRETCARLDRGGVSGTKRAWLRSVCIALDAVTVLAERYASLLAETAEREKDPVRAGELAEMARVCAKVAHEAPETLHEAMQLYLLVYTALCQESSAGICFGRMDQALAPYAGGVPDETLDQLVDCLLIKCNHMYDIYDGGETGYNGMEGLVLGGVASDGTSAVNRLSYAFLRAGARLRLCAPEISLRIAANTPPDFLRLACEANAAGLNTIAYFNDDAVVRALMHAGFPPEDARSWSLDQCQDILIEGCSDFFFAGIVSLGHLVTDAVMAADDDAAYAELYADILRRIDAELDLIERRSVEGERRYIRYDDDPCALDGYEYELGDTRPQFHFGSLYGYDLISPQPLMSATLLDCIENATDLTRFGLRYRQKGILATFPTSGANSLAAVRYCVYEQGTLTLAQVKAALARNYAGMEDVRHTLLNAPKWGNDDDRADRTAAELFEYALRAIGKRKNAWGKSFLSGLHQPHTQASGRNLGATPDGRFAGTPVPVSASPQQGTDVNGPTAALNSIAKIDPDLLQWNMAATLSFVAPGTEKREEFAENLHSLIQGYFDQGGVQLQPNVLSVQALRDAQAHPAQHRDILVRVWGVSAYFVEISKAFQDEIISRTAHALV